MSWGALERGWMGENNGVLIPQEGNSCQMPPLSNKCSACQECVPTSNSTEQRQERVTCQHTDPENGDRGGEKRGRGVFLGGLQTVYINSVWKSIIKTSVKNNALYSILYSTAKNVSVCWSMYAWVCLSVTIIVWESLWCDQLLEVLLYYQTYTPSPLLSALF